MIGGFIISDFGFKRKSVRFTREDLMRLLVDAETNLRLEGMGLSDDDRARVLALRSGEITEGDFVERVLRSGGVL